MKTGLLVKTDFFSDVIFKTSNLKLNSNISMGEKRDFFFLKRRRNIFFLFCERGYKLYVNTGKKGGKQI